MEYRELGRTGMNVSPLCLGAMMFGTWGEADHDKSIASIHRALDAGINFIDTADVYSQGESERIVGKALAGERRDNVILATKFHGQMGMPADRLPMDAPDSADPNMVGNSRRWIIAEVENSLRRLGTDWIDLYQVHRPEPGTDIEETLSALTDLRAQGKIRAFGSSTFPPSSIVEAQWTSDRRGLGRFVSEQPPYSILARRIEREMLPVAERYGLGVIPWSPLAGGWLSGKYRKGSGDVGESHRAGLMPGGHDMDDPENQAKLEAVDKLADVADQAGIPMIHMALAFTLRHPAVTAPIIGPRTMEHLEGQLGAADVTLSDDVMDAIDEIVAPGTNIASTAEGYTPPALADPMLRRTRLA